MNTADIKPVISVAMGICYRYVGLDKLIRSINSILGQTYTDFELLICENGSTDPAREYLKERAEEDHRIRLINGTGADTLAAKLNRCISAARGDWIARMDDDDYSEPTRFEKQLEYMKNEPGIDFAGCNIEQIQNGTSAGMIIFPQFPEVRDFVFSQPFSHPAMLFSKGALEAVGGYSEDRRFSGCEDYDLLLRLYERGYKGSNLQMVLLRYTIPDYGKRNRTFRMRINEVYTRMVRFKSSGLLPRYFVYVIKPLIVWLIPVKTLQKLKEKRLNARR
jgi:glycosyltransferase EpsE